MTARRSAAGATATALLIATLWASGPAAQDVVEEPAVFPAGRHRDEVFFFCTACHSSRLVRNQALSREQWDATLTWMTERHAMPPLEGEDRERFLDYLAQAFGPAAGASAPRSPFLTRPPKNNPFAPR